MSPLTVTAHNLRSAQFGTNPVYISLVLKRKPAELLQVKAVLGDKPRKLVPDFKHTAKALTLPLCRGSAHHIPVQNVWSIQGLTTTTLLCAT